MAAQKDPISTLVIGLGGSGAWTAVHLKKQLLDTYHRTIPDNVSIAVLDTAANAIARVGDVELTPQEYSHIGGDSYDIVQRVANTNDYPHIKSWLMAEYYLQNLPKATFMLDQGAGQFRQFGRLALFRDVMTVAQSEVANLLERKLVRVASQTKEGSPSISVAIVGSLVGGTGAGLFLDIPHLVRQVARLNGISVIIRAFLFLPQAFKRALNPQDIEAAKPRTFAALRELNRFLLNQDYKYGYPMHYHNERAGVNHALWRAKRDSKLYDFVYVIDGEGSTNVNTRDFHLGSAPVVADALMSYIDGEYGNVLEQYNANIQAKITLRQNEVGRKAFIGTLGTFSIILPIQQLIEGWAYDLAREMVGALAPGARFDDQDRILQLSADHNLERTETSMDDEVERLMTSGTDIADPHNEENPRIAPTALWRPLYGFFREGQENQRRLLQKLDNIYNLDDWQAMLVPDPLATDPATRRVIAETGSILKETITDYSMPSDRREPRGNPAQDHGTITREASRFITRQLGDVGRSGVREGGLYEEALDKFVDYQVDRFRKYVSAYIMHTLNGYDNRDIERGKVGKLGFLIAVLERWRGLMAFVRELLEQLRQGISPDVVQARQAEHEESLRDAQKFMVAEASKGGFLGVGKSPAIKAQEAFLTETQRYVEYHRTQFARNAVTKTARQLEKFLEATLSELKLWAEILATDTHSLHTELLQGSRRVRVARQTAEDVVNHWVIEDEEWEEHRYDQYVDTMQARRQFYEAWNWTTTLTQNQKGETVVSLEATLNGQTLRSDMRGRWSEENLNLLLDFARAIFRSATERESVIAYLMDDPVYSDGRELGRLLKQKAGYLLTMPVNNLTGGRIPTNVLLAYHDDTNTNQRAYLREVMGVLANLDDPDHEDSVLHRAVQSTDPFRLTLLSAAELVPLQGIQAYLDYQRTYERQPFDARQRLHIFPAEVRSVEYEELISEQMEVAKRMLQDRVALLMEQESRFMDFLMLYAHDLIYQAKDDQGDNQTRFLWVLEAPPVSERARTRSNVDHWCLTEPSDNPSLLEAAIAYVLLEKDVRSFRPDATIDKEIPYAHILKHLRKVRLNITAERIKNDDIALDHERLRDWLEFAFMPPLNEDGEEDLSNWTDRDEDEYQEIAALLVRYDILHTLAARLKQRMPQLDQAVQTASQRLDSGQRYDHLTHMEEERDLYAVAIVALEKEMGQIYRLVKMRYETKTGEQVD